MNVLENSDVVTAETLMHFRNELELYPKCDKQWEDKFAKEGAKVGDTIAIRQPVNFDIREGEQFSPQALIDRTINFTVDQRIGVDFTYSTAEKTLNLDRVSERYLQPAARRLANEVDLRIARAMSHFGTLSFGTPGTAPTSVSSFQSAMTRMADLGVPKGKRHIVVTPAVMQAIVTDLRGLIEPGGTIAKQNLNGAMYNAFGGLWDQSQNLDTHITGAVTGSGLVKGANQSGASILTDDWTASTVGILKKGDKINFTTSYAVNPITGATLGWLRTFTVTADVDSDSNGDATVPIDPPIVLTGPYKNVSNAPANDTDIQLYAHASTYASKTSPTNLVFHPAACACAVIGLAMPDGGAKGRYMADEDAGISMRFVQQYDIDTDKNKCRFDVLLGIKVQLPDFICVVPA